MEYRAFLSPLTDSDKRQLRTGQFKDIKSLGLVSSLMFLCVVALVEKIPSDVFISILVLLAITFGSIGLMVLHAFGSSPLFKKDIESNSKTVVQGVLENKIQEEITVSGSAGSLGSQYYYFLIGDNKIRVPWQQYYAFQIGESIEIYMATNSKWVLDIERKSAKPAQDYSCRVSIEYLTVSEKIGMAGRAIFATVILSVFVFIFGYTAYNTYPDTWGFFIPTGLLAIVFIGMILNLIFTTTKSIIVGKKEIVEGTLRGKEKDGGATGKHYFILGDQKFAVGNLRFNSPQVGEPIRIIRLKNGDILDWNFA